MMYKSFNGNKISMLGLGCLRFPMEEGDKTRIDRDKAREIIAAAFECGINYFDTAYIYQDGDSERVLGEILSSYPRDSYYLATKFNTDGGVDIETAFNHQLERCKTDYFDFYLYHSVDESHIDKYMAHPEYLEFLLEQKKAGKIRYLGFSTHCCPENLERFLNWYGGFDMALMQLNYLDWKLLDAKRQYEILKERNIPVWVMEPLKGGHLTRLCDEALEILNQAAPDRTQAEWGMRFLMDLDNVQTVLSGMSSPEMVRQNAATFENLKPLNEEEKKTLFRAADVHVKAMGVPCSACRYCCPTCPAELDIPYILQAYNELRITHKNFWRVGSFDDKNGPAACLQCGECLNHCPQKIDIPGTMAAFAAHINK